MMQILDAPAGILGQNKYVAGPDFALLNSKDMMHCHCGTKTITVDIHGYLESKSETRCPSRVGKSLLATNARETA